MPSSASTFATAPSRESVFRVVSESKQLGQPPIRTDAGKNLLVLHLPCHHGAVHALALECLDQLREFAKRKPVNGRRTARFDFGRCLLLDRRHDDLISLRPRRIQHEKREFAVAGDEAKFFFRRGMLNAPTHWGGVSLASEGEKNAHTDARNPVSKRYRLVTTV